MRHIQPRLHLKLGPVHTLILFTISTSVLVAFKVDGNTYIPRICGVLTYSLRQLSVFELAKHVAVLLSYIVKFTLCSSERLLSYCVYHSSVCTDLLGYDKSLTVFRS